jgi:hypothetical protein
MSSHMRVPDAQDKFTEALNGWEEAKHDKRVCIQESVNVEDGDGWRYRNYANAVEERMAAATVALHDALSDLIREMVASERRSVEI